MAAGGSCGDPLAMEPLPEPQPERSPAEGHWGDQESTAEIQFKILRGHSDTVSSCHFCCGDSKILSCSYDRTVKLWFQSSSVSLRYTGAQQGTSGWFCTNRTRSPGTSAWTRLVWRQAHETRDNTWVDSIDENGSLPNQTPLDSFKDVVKGFPVQIFEEHTAPVSECNLSPDDRRVVTSSYDNTVKTWDMETGKVLWTIEHEGIVTSCNISCDGKYVVSGSDKGNAISVFDAVSATEVACVQGHHRSTITKCCFDPDNQRVTSVSYDKTIKLWDMVARSTSITIKEGHSNAISDCCFTSNGRYLCTASWDKSLKIWDIKTGEFRSRGPVTLNQGHEGSVSSCCFSQDASLVVSGGYDNTIAIWETGAGYKKLSLKGHWDWVTDVAISESKKWILSASKDSTLRLWNIEKMDLIPSVIESRKEKGSKIAQCEECERPFLSLQHGHFEVISKCVFCRLSSPARNTLALPPSIPPDL